MTEAMTCLTPDNIVITQDGDVFIPIIGCKDAKSRLPKAKQLKQQILKSQEMEERLKKRLEKEKEFKKHDYGYGEYNDHLIEELQKIQDGEKE